MSYFPFFVELKDTEVKETKKINVDSEILKFKLAEQLYIEQGINIFDENESKVEELCRQGSVSEISISSYVTETFEKNRNLNKEDWERTAWHRDKRRGIATHV